MGRREAHGLFGVELVVALDHHLDPELAEEVREVPREAVVVVDEEQQRDRRERSGAM
jgi:hypothetical protein